MIEEENPQTNFTLSPSVQAALSGMDGQTPVSASAFVSVILDKYGHRKEYAAGGFTSFTISETPKKELPQVWLNQIQKLFDVEKFLSLSKNQKQGPLQLHGRLVIAGLCLLDKDLQAQLESNGAFDKLMNEITPSLSGFLTQTGQNLLETGTSFSDSVVFLPDDAIRSSAEDLLGREGFALYIEKIIKGIPDSGAFMMHLSAPWGSGKSSFLNLLKAKMIAVEQGEKQWHVVEFNAWRHQHIPTPWWSLMDIVYRETRGKLNFKNQVQEGLWRFNTGPVPLILLFIIFIWLIAIMDVKNMQVKKMGELSGNITTFIALLSTLGGILFGASRSLFFGSREAAESYIQQTRDPMNTIKKRFDGLIERLPVRVLIFIDDLDRCQSAYTVNLMEGIQTLFREARVVILVAADRRWLNACYEVEYKNLEPLIKEDGKLLGALFLEKTFRASIPLPGIPLGLKDRYWQYLINKKETEADQAEKEKENARIMAKEAYYNSKSDVQDRKVFDRDSGLSFTDRRALRTEAAVRLASPEILANVEHSLKPYADLLEPNPRAMKRLVNSYGANAAINILTELDIEKHQLVLWTILSSRWPTLAEWLLESPQKNLELLNSRDGNSQIPPYFKEIAEKTNLMLILQGGPKEKEPLSVDTIQKCKQMRA